MAEHPYMPFFPEKFFADTLHLHWDARAVYLELLAIAWNRGGALPNDQNQLRLMVGCYSKAWGRIWREIAPFWTLGEDGRLHQKRLDKEWQRVVARHPRPAAQKAGNRRIPKNPDGKNPNDFSCAPARESHTHTHIEEEDARIARGRALARADPPVKNQQGGRNGPHRNKSAADAAWRAYEAFEHRVVVERRARERAGEQGADSETSSNFYLEQLSKVRH